MYFLYIMWNKVILMVLKSYKKWSSFSSLLCHNFSEIFRKWIISVRYVSINTILRNFQACFAHVSQHFQRKNQKKLCLFKCPQYQHYIVSRQHELMGSALTQVNTELIKMSFIHHVSLLIRWIFPPEQCCQKSPCFFTPGIWTVLNPQNILLIIRRTVLLVAFYYSRRILFTYLCIYCINVIERMTLASICGERV